MSVDGPLVQPLTEDHSLCCNVAVEADVRHMCQWEFGHLGSHECSCGKFWANWIERVKG